MAGNALYDVGMRLRAAELHDEGHGRAAIAALLGMPEETVREWLCTYRSAGIEVLAMMGKKHTAYSFETKLAAVRAVVDEGMTKPQDARGLQAGPALGHGLAVPAGRVVQAAGGGRRGAEHVPEGQLHRQRRDGAGVRPYEGRVLSRKKMALLRRLQERPGRIHHPLEHEKEAG